MRKNWEYRRGDIYLADLDPTVGSEIGGVRPVLVLQNNTGNHYGRTIIVAPLTSNTYKKASLPTHFILEKGNGLRCPSIVMMEQLRTLDKHRVIEYMGTVSREILDSPAFRNCLASSVALYFENEQYP